MNSSRLIFRPLRVAFRFGNTPYPGRGTTYRFLFAYGKPILAFLVRELLKHRFLMHDLAPERIYEANVAIHVCTDKWMRVVAEPQSLDVSSTDHHVRSPRPCRRVTHNQLDYQFHRHEQRNTRDHDAPQTTSADVAGRWDSDGGDPSDNETMRMPF